MDFDTTNLEIGSPSESPRLIYKDRFFMWKRRMTAHLDRNLLETITEGPHIPPMEQSLWSEDDKQKVALEAKAKYILTVSLPDEIYSFVMHCESAKEMWDNLILLFEGTDETRECRRSVLIQQYESFAYKHGESLTEIYNRFNKLINDLSRYNKSYDNKDKLNKFMRSVPPPFNTMSNFIRQSLNLETDSLYSLYQILLSWEDEWKMNKSKNW